MEASKRLQNWGWAWLALSVALAFHVWDETVHDFLSVYNPAVRAIREQVPLLPLPTFTFGIWLGGLITAVVLLLLLSFFAFRGVRRLRSVAYAFAVIMIGNALLHLVSSLYFGRMMPGVYSSPLLIIAAFWLLILLWRRVSSRDGARLSERESR